MTPHPSPVTSRPNGFALAVVAAILILVAWAVLTVAYAARRAWTRRRGNGGSP